MNLKDHQQRLMAAGQREPAEFIGSLIAELDSRDASVNERVSAAIMAYDSAIGNQSAKEPKKREKEITDFVNASLSGTQPVNGNNNIRARVRRILRRTG